MSRPSPTAADYTVALEAPADRGLSPSARRMLVAHYALPDRVATMRHLAAAIGAPADHARGNLTYGRFAGRVRRELGLPSRSLALSALATYPEPPVDALGEFAFRMRRELARALERLRPVTPERRTRDVTRPAPSALEGERRFELRVRRRRERRLRDAKIRAALEQSPDGRLRFEVPGCGFDFRDVYGLHTRLSRNGHSDIALTLIDMAYAPGWMRTARPSSTGRPKIRGAVDPHRHHWVAVSNQDQPLVQARRPPCDTLAVSHDFAAR